MNATYNNHTHTCIENDELQSANDRLRQNCYETNKVYIDYAAQDTITNHSLARIRPDLGHYSSIKRSKWLHGNAYRPHRRHAERIFDKTDIPPSVSGSKDLKSVPI